MKEVKLEDGDKYLKIDNTIVVDIDITIAIDTTIVVV